MVGFRSAPQTQISSGHYALHGWITPRLLRNHLYAIALRNPFLLCLLSSHLKEGISHQAKDEIVKTLPITEYERVGHADRGQVLWLHPAEAEVYRLSQTWIGFC